MVALKLRMDKAFEMEGRSGNLEIARLVEEHGRRYYPHHNHVWDALHKKFEAYQDVSKTFKVSYEEMRKGGGELSTLFFDIVEEFAEFQCAMYWLVRSLSGSKFYESNYYWVKHREAFHSVLEDE